MTHSRIANALARDAHALRRLAASVGLKAALLDHLDSHDAHSEAQALRNLTDLLRAHAGTLQRAAAIVAKL